MKNNYEIDTSIYEEKNILQAIEDFSEVAEIFFKDGKIEIIGEKEETDEIFYELCNYIIGIQI